MTKEVRLLQADWKFDHIRAQTFSSYCMMWKIDNMASTSDMNMWPPGSRITGKKLLQKITITFTWWPEIIS